MGKPEGQRPLGRCCYRCNIDSILDLQAVGWGGMDWMELNKVRNGCRGVVKVVMKLLVPKSAWNFVTNYGTVSLV
jgi:hypothetical protein